MSSQLLYQVFRVKSYRLTKLETEQHRVFLHVEPQEHRVCCSACRSRNVIRRGESVRWFRNLPVGSELTWVIATLPRVQCRDCGLVRQIDSGLAGPKRTYTHAFERYALELSKCTTIQDAARHLDGSWDIIKDIQKRNLQRRFGKPKLKNLKEIAIDEVAVGKGHRYFTLVLDLRTGAVVYVGDGKGVAALTLFWKRLRSAHAKVRAVATDMGAAYIRAVRTHLPHAVHVFDHFHVIKLYNDKLSAFRR